MTMILKILSGIASLFKILGAAWAWYRDYRLKRAEERVHQLEVDRAVDEAIEEVEDVETTVEGFRDETTDGVTHDFSDFNRGE